MKNNKKFKRGDIVTWKSQSSGHYKTKIGEIQVIVPAGVPGLDIRVFPRNHESYIVLVKNKLYWPRVCHLVKC